MTTLTLTTLLLVALGVFGSRGYGTALALGGATAAGAAVVVGTIAVPTFYAIAVGTVVALAAQLVRRGPVADGSVIRARPRSKLPPGAPLLVAFAMVATFVTLTASTLFDGMAVQLPTGPGRLYAAAFTSSNIAQMGYLVLGVCVVVFLGRSASARPQLIGLAAGTTLILSGWRFLHTELGAPFPEGFFDNSPFFAYIETAPGDIQRFRGILSEPSSLAGTCLVVLAYMFSRQAQLHGWRRAGAWAMIALAVYLGAISTSATFVVAGVATAAIAASATLYRFLFRRLAIRTAGHVAVVGVVIAGVFLLPALAGFVQGTVDGKVASSSYTERSSADSTSFGLVLDTWGYGVGIGSNRASSFLPGLLSTTGVVGTALFVIAVAVLVRGGYAVASYRPVVWALVSVLVAKLIAGPDLSDPSGILWLSLGLLSRAGAVAAHAAPRSRRRGASRAGPPSASSVYPPRVRVGVETRSGGA